MIIKNVLSISLKIFIAFLALYFLFNQFTDKSSIKELNNINLLKYIQSSYKGLFIVLIMMCINWVLESLKWKYLISKIEDISIYRSIRAIFSGITVSAFTPNRIGEYGGRVFCLDKADRGQAVFITIIGSMSQLLTTIIFGSIGFLFLPYYNKELYAIINLFDLAYPIYVFIFIILNFFLVLLFLKSSLLSNLLYKIKFLNNYKKYINVFSFYNSNELINVLLYSIARYIVFSTQFFILLRLFDVEIYYFDAIVLIMSMFLIMSIIPTIAITELGVRGSIAILLFGLISSNHIGILLATFFLWIINLFLPALIGVIFVFSLKFFRK